MDSRGSLVCREAGHRRSRGRSIVGRHTPSSSGAGARRFFRSGAAEPLAAKKQHKKVGQKVDVNDDHCFVGFDAYKQVIASDVDVVLLAVPPHFRPKPGRRGRSGKHVFAEKPVAVDALGVKKVLEACALAKRRNGGVSGLCWRYNNIVRAAMQQVHEGAVGDIVALECNYNASLPGKAWPMVREAGWSDMEWQMRTGTGSPGSRAIISSSKRYTASIKPPGPCTTSRRSRPFRWAACRPALASRWEASSTTTR